MLITLKKYSVENIPIKLKYILSKYKYSFNPSFVIHNKKNYLAIRLYEEELNSFLFSWYDDGNIEIINLTEYFNKTEKISKVSDPKLFVMNDTLCGTFNTGYTQDYNNDIVLFEVRDFKIDKYYFCDYNKRSFVEKNWAFYRVNNELFSLYSISPLIVLKENKFNKNRIEFKEYYFDKNIEIGDYSIGTPMVKIDNKFLFIAHKKISWLGKRLYLGRPFTFMHIGKPKVQARKIFLIHSIISLFGSTKKFNSNLISCSYFSGINYYKNKIQLSYGINDVKSNIINIRIKKLWH